MKLKLKDILPNPDRDFSLNPLRESRIEALVLSIKETDFWDNIVIRINAKGNPEAAHGHHRIEAAKRAGITEANFIVRKWDDDEMFKAMVRENSKEYDYNIHALLESVKGVVQKVANGKLSFKLDEKVNKQHIRYAPSFKPGVCSDILSEDTKYFYTASNIANYLESTESAGEGRAEKANRAVTAALNALELMQCGVKLNLYKTGRDGEEESVTPYELLVITRDIKSRMEKTSASFKKEQATIQVNTEKMAKLDENRRAEETKAKAKQAELLKRELEARAEEDAKEAQRLNTERIRVAEQAEARAKVFQENRAALDAKVKAAEERAEQSRVQNRDLPTRHAVKTLLFKLNTIVSERNSFRDELKAIARDKAVNQAERETIRQAILAAATWYEEQAIQFRPVVQGASK
jgi:hypothetical protein